MDNGRVVVTGAAGMLGSALLELAPPQYEAIGVDLPEGDISKTYGARAAIATHDPLAVIHCAAYTDVDGCTQDPERAHAVNSRGAANVAIVCQECECHLIALSTDYVFDGEKGAPYDEYDEPNPINAYGESKLLGEVYARESHDSLLIVRTQWLYGAGGGNFVDTILGKVQEEQRLRVVADEYGSPTYARDLAARLWELVALRSSGILHLTNSGVCSWADLARVAVGAAGCEGVSVEDCSWRDWESPTRRPHYSVLASARLGELGIDALRPWEDAVREYVGCA